VPRMGCVSETIGFDQDSVRAVVRTFEGAADALREARASLASEARSLGLPATAPFDGALASFIAGSQQVLGEASSAALQNSAAIVDTVGDLSETDSRSAAELDGMFGAIQTPRF
jgi:hypothetical protein